MQPNTASGIVQEIGHTQSINTLEDDIEVELVGDTLVFHGVAASKLDPIIEELPAIKHTDKYEIKVYNIPEQAIISLVKMLPFGKLATVLLGVLQGISITKIINILSQAGLAVVEIIKVIFQMLAAATGGGSIAEDIEEYIKNKDEPEEEPEPDIDEPDEYPDIVAGDDEEPDDNVSDPVEEEVIEPDEPEEEQEGEPELRFA